MVRSEPQASVSNHAGPQRDWGRQRNRREKPSSRESPFRIVRRFRANRTIEPGGARNDPDAATNAMRHADA